MGNGYELGLCTKKTSQKSVNNARYTYQPIDENYKISKPTVICLSGNNCMGREEAAGMVSLASDLINPDKNVEFLSITYRPSPINNTRAQFTADDAKHLAETILLPLATHNGKAFKDVNNACKNVRKVTLFAYCYGYTARQEIENSFYYLLRKVGYTKNDCAKILEQVFCVAYAPMQLEDEFYGSNFLLKSFDDGKFGSEYHQEKFGEDYRPKNIKCGEIVRKNNTINLYTDKLAQPNDKGERVDNHNITLVRRNSTWNIYSVFSTFSAEVASQCMAYALASSVANSMANCESKIFIPLDIDEIENSCEDIVDKLTRTTKGQKVVAQKQKRIEDYIKETTEVKFNKVMKEFNVTEADIVSGSKPINKLLKDYKGIVIYNSIYDKIINNSSKSLDEDIRNEVKLKRRMFPDISSSCGIIWNDATLSFENSNEKLLYTTLYHRLFEGKDVSGSIKYQVVVKGDDRYLVLSDNYGSYKSDCAKVKDLFSNWKTTYSQSDLTIEPNKMQTSVINNLCMHLNIDSNNIIYKSSQLTR